MSKNSCKNARKTSQILPKTITQSRKYLLTYLLAYLLLRHKLILITTSRVKNLIKKWNNIIYLLIYLLTYVSF